MPVNFDALEAAADDDDDEVIDSDEADVDDGDADAAGRHSQLLGDLKQSLLGKARRRETAPPSASVSMDVHGLRRRAADAAGEAGSAGAAKRTRVQEVLATALGGEAAKHAVGQELRTAQRRHRVLEAPVKLVEAKSQRMAAYERANKDLGRWYGYVERNRLAEEVAFPLPPPPGAPKPQSAADYQQRARADIARGAAAAASSAPAGGSADDLEAALYRRLYSETAITKAAAGDGDDRQQQQHQLLDGAKIRERLASGRRLVARRHFLEAKLKRQARIKSKAYRRHARRARLKQEAAELTALKDSDPAEFAERMAALDRARADERISQRHRSGGKFALRQKLRAKFDDVARQAVQEMVQRGRDLTEKTDGEGDEGGDGEGDSSDEEAEAEAEAAAVAQLPADLLDDWNVAGGDGDGGDDGHQEEDDRDAALPASLRPARVATAAGVAARSAATGAVKQRTLELDLSHLPALAGSRAALDDDEGDAVEPSGRLARLRTDELLMEGETAAGGGDAVEEFEREKADVADQEQPKDVDLFLPGWNTWTGPGTRPVAPDRRDQFLIKAPKRHRRDATLGSHVIIREKLESSQARRRHLVKEVPFPYANAEQFESAMRTPICREFNSILAHKRLTAPKVSVRMGRAIGPVPKDAILRRKRRQRTNAEIAKGGRKL